MDITDDLIKRCYDEFLEQKYKYQINKNYYDGEHKILTDYETSSVTFKELSDSEINNYLNMDEPYDKAGSYAIQGYGSAFIKSINGCYTNIVGISTYKLVEMLKKFDIHILQNYFCFIPYFKKGEFLSS